MRPIPALAALVLALAAALPARAETLRVDPAAGNSTFSAVFDAKLGERITAQSSAVACDVTLDEASGLASGACSVPLASITVDNEPTKSEHFRDWATNKKSDPAACRLEARFEGVRLGKLAPETPVPFEARIPFTVCGRGPADGRKERVTGSAVLFPPGSYGSAKTIRVRATVERFDRDAYRIGPRHTEGWLARVQSLAKVVAEEGTVELTLFARPAPAR
jgi:hypothetical protein